MHITLGYFRDLGLPGDAVESESFFLAETVGCFQRCLGSSLPKDHGFCMKRQIRHDPTSEQTGWWLDALTPEMPKCLCSLWMLTLQPLNQPTNDKLLRISGGARSFSYGSNAMSTKALFARLSINSRPQGIEVAKKWRHTQWALPAREVLYRTGIKMEQHDHKAFIIRPGRVDWY